MSEVGKTAPVLSVLPASPVSAEEFAALMSSFGSFAAKTSFAIAVSGGPDSMALALLMKDWAATRGHSLHVFIVDHALRSESAWESSEAQNRLSSLGVTATILRWEHEGVTSRIHVTARRARYELLTKACKNAGISHLLLAHQREDQAETIAMRLAKGSGIYGLSGIASDSVKDGVRLLRPLLSIAKERLIATCTAAKMPFVVDPSNSSEKYARGRLRRILPLLAEEGLTIDRLIDLGERAATARQALDFYAQELLSRIATQSSYGVITLKHGELIAAPRATSERALISCLQTVHPNDYAPELQSLTQLIDALSAGAEMPSRTLHGCLVSHHGDTVMIMREYAQVTHAPSITVGQTVLWDNRWQVTLSAPISGTNQPYTIRPLGTPVHDVLDRLAPRLRHDLPQGRARATLPSLWIGQNLAVIPKFTTEKLDDSCSARLRHESFCAPFRV